MKLWLYVGMFFCIGKTSGQADAYYPLPLSNAIWRQDNFETYCGPPYGLCSSETWYFDGDTIVSGKEYSKLYSNAIYYFINDSIYHGFDGLIRQDTVEQKIFWWGSSSAHEQVLMDFNVKSGDTVNSLDFYGRVTSVDSVLIDNKYRRRINFYNEYPFPINIIEGIGTNGGLIN